VGRRESSRKDERMRATERTSDGEEKGGKEEARGGMKASGVL